MHCGGRNSDRRKGDDVLFVVDSPGGNTGCREEDGGVREQQGSASRYRRSVSTQGTLGVSIASAGGD